MRLNKVENIQKIIQVEFMEAPFPNNEPQRIERLLQYDILDTAAEQAFDDITILASHIFQTPIARVSLIDAERQWFKSKLGLAATETCRDIAFCAHAIVQNKVFVVEDALNDERFANNPLVISDPHIRFYAGAPLITPDGFALGTLCVIDYVPRQISLAQQDALRILAHQVMTQLELRRNLAILAKAISERERAEAEVRKALEKEKELSELKSRFVSMTSHEFRTPLSTILSSAELLEHYSQRLTDDKKLRHLERIQSAVGHMTDLLNDVLLVGQAEAGKLEFNPEPLNLENFCRQYVEEIQASEGKEHLIKFVSKGCCHEGFLDEKLLRQILGNLLSNAIKYSPQGSLVSFELSCLNEQAVLDIQDSGIGITPEDQIHLFESFYRAKNVGNVSGTGLGLTIVKKCVELHGGSILVTSEVGSSTTFKVTLPLNNQVICPATLVE